MSVRTSPPECIIYDCCPDEFGCIPGRCPDFIIKRHDTKPPFKYSVQDEDGKPLDLTGLVLEASMWAKAKLKCDVSDTATSLQLANNIGFQQVLAGDFIVLDRVRSPEHMLVTGFDENAKTIQVQRGVHGTTASCWKKGTPLRIFRFMGAAATTEMILDDIREVDGSLRCDEVVESLLVYNWSSFDTCTPGCYYLEFKLLSMDPNNIFIPSVITCYSGYGVSWVRRFPVCGDGFIIKICDSPTAEL